MKALTKKQLTGVKTKGLILALGGSGVLSTCDGMENDTIARAEGDDTDFHYTALPFLEYLHKTFGAKIVLMSGAKEFKRLFKMYGYSHLLHSKATLPRSKHEGDGKKGDRLVKWAKRNNVKRVLAITTTNYSQFADAGFAYMDPEDFRLGSPKLFLGAIKAMDKPAKTAAKKKPKAAKKPVKSKAKTKKVTGKKKAAKKYA